MNAQPLVSICIPTYNAAAYLKSCLDSAVSQTYPHVEILVCDDGSTDDTLAILAGYSQRHPQLRLVQNKTNLGMVNNWNNCIEQAKGEWIKFLFQDDLLEPACVAEMMKACAQQDVQMAVCSRNFILQKGILPDLEKDFGEGFIKKAEEAFGAVPFVSSAQLAAAVRQHLIHNFIGEPTCYLFRKNLCKMVGVFNPLLTQVVDYEFIVRLGLVEGLAFLPAPLVHFRVHSRSQSSVNKLDAVRGTVDLILLQHQFLYHPAFEKLRAVTGTALLDTSMKHLYHSTCKHKGKALLNEALTDIRNRYPAIAALKYSFFRYMLYRQRMHRWYRKLKNRK